MRTQRSQSTRGTRAVVRAPYIRRHNSRCSVPGSQFRSGTPQSNTTLTRPIPTELAAAPPLPVAAAPAAVRASQHQPSRCPAPPACPFGTPRQHPPSHHQGALPWSPFAGSGQPGMVLPDDSERPVGTSFILQWFGSVFAEDEYTKAATRRVLTELAVFYVFIAVGFLALYLTWKSNANLKKWKADLAATMAKQKGRQFEPSDAAKLYGMF